MPSKINKNLIATLVIGAALTLPTALMAKVSGRCGSCHTMHNSRGGSPMAESYDATTKTWTWQSTPYSSLLRNGCIGCHYGTNSAGSNRPRVLARVGAPTTTSLAGGDFYWVSQGADNTGHNVAGLTTVDSILGTTPPGGTDLGTQLTCASTTGCHGTQDTTDEIASIAGGHHGDGGTLLTDTSKRFVAGSTTDMSNAFRMLSGVIGIEDDNWEFGATTADDGTTNHNQYYGVDRAADGAPAAGSISSLCANCHGEFHTGAISADGSMSSPWVRHPTDFDMARATGTEYASYNGGDGTNPAPYSLIAPVASNTITGADADLLANVNVTNGSADGSAIVTCLSCHRAHGSPYADLLRWDYTGSMEPSHTGPNNTGCFICHTTKDDI